MRIEALKPLRVTLRSGEIRYLKPGKPAQFTCEDGARLLECAPGKVRLLDDQLDVGMIMSWESPLFGLLSATALEVLPHGVKVFHPLTDRDCVIPLTWIRETR